MRKCWPGEMESGVVCLFWLSGRAQQALSLGTGKEGCRGLNGREDGKIGNEKNGSMNSVKVSTQVKPDLW